MTKFMLISFIFCFMKIIHIQLKTNYLKNRIMFKIMIKIIYLSYKG